MADTEEKPDEAAPEEATPPEAETTAAEGAGPVPKADVYALLQLTVMQFAALAWQKMGLQADPFTNQVDKDVEQARLAIDTVGALVEKLQPHLHGQQARDYQSLLTDLRLNFVKQSEA